MLWSAIRELHHDDADVVDHGQQHLAEVLRLPFLAGRKRDRAEFRHPFDDVGDVGAEHLLDALDAGERVFDDVVEQAGGDGHDVQAHVGEDVGDFERMDEVGFAGMADLSLVLEGGKHIGPPEQLDIGVRGGRPDLFDQILEPNHGEWCPTRRAAPGFSARGRSTLYDTAGVTRDSGVWKASSSSARAVRAASARRLDLPGGRHYTGRVLPAHCRPALGLRA